MIKKTLYPKTKRIGNAEVVVTEKLDGSNIGFFKIGNDLVVAQRNNIFALKEIEEVKGMLYKGLYQWLKDNGTQLLDSLNDKSGIFGEWIGMGKISYRESLNKHFYMFAKANITEDLEVENVYWERELFVYPFVEQVIPDFIGIVPLVKRTNQILSVNELDSLYESYTEKVDRNVEGFVIQNNGNIQKYVRMKNGIISEHKL